jgi:hypothetical protein
MRIPATKALDDVSRRIFRHSVNDQRFHQRLRIILIYDRVETGANINLFISHGDDNGNAGQFVTFHLLAIKAAQGQAFATL